MKRIINLIIVIFILAIGIVFNCNAKEAEPGFIERTPENSALIDEAIEYNRERFNSHAWEVLMEKKNKLDEERKGLKITSWEDIEKDKEFAIRQIMLLYEAYRDIIKEIPNSKFKDKYIREMNMQKMYLSNMGVVITEDNIDINSNINNDTNSGVEAQSENGKSAIIWSGN